MAFATTNLRKSVVGDMRITRGQFTAGTADAAGTIPVEGAQVYAAFLFREDAADNSTSFTPQPVPYSVSGANPVTVTFYNLGPVTTGRFIIFHL